jgi:hypothetical protein
MAGPLFLTSDPSAVSMRHSNPRSVARSSFSIDVTRRSCVMRSAI